jgi:hypothetical protein
MLLQGQVWEWGSVTQVKGRRVEERRCERHSGTWKDERRSEDLPGEALAGLVKPGSPSSREYRTGPKPGRSFISWSEPWDSHASTVAPAPGRRGLLVRESAET